jgi:biopolymer transport protein ExbD
MNLKRKHKISAEFSMASMTDLIFLLLIFFMLTSSFVTPSGMPVNLPTTRKEQPMQPQKTSITITSDLRYYINDSPTNFEAMVGQLKMELGTDPASKVVVLHIDEMVPTKYFVQVAGIANELGARVSIATKPE